MGRGGGGGGSGGRDDSVERPEVRMETGVPRIQIGDYLAQNRAMRQVNAYLDMPQYFASRQSFICAADRFICSRR